MNHKKIYFSFSLLGINIAVVGQKNDFYYLYNSFQGVLFLLSYTFSSYLPFYSLLWPPQYKFTQEILFFSPSYVDSCVFLLGSSLLSSYLGLWTIGWFSFALCLEALMSEYILYLLFWFWVTSLNMMFSRSIHLSANFKMSLFLPLCSIPLCKCTTFSYSFFSWGASRLFPGSGYYR